MGSFHPGARALFLSSLKPSILVEKAEHVAFTTMLGAQKSQGHVPDSQEGQFHFPRR